MLDSTAPADIPAGTGIVAGYIDGSWAWSTADWARFGGLHVTITWNPANLAAKCLDCEPGNCVPADVPGWVAAKRKGGEPHPWVYCMASQWGACKAACANAGVPEPLWWIAAYPGHGATIPPGAIGHQYADHGPNGEHYDCSVVADHIPGLDPGGTMTPDDMWNHELGSPGVWSQQTAGAAVITQWSATFGDMTGVKGLSPRSLVGMLNTATRTEPTSANDPNQPSDPAKRYHADATTYARNADGYGWDLCNVHIPALLAKLDALSTGGVDIDTLATAVAAKLSSQLATAVADEIEKRMKQ